jgi:Na+/proline symporter
MLFVFYRLFPPAIAFTRTDTIFPTFVVTHMPHVISGLLISAILAAAMSNLSVALNSLSTTTIVDFLYASSPWLDREAPHAAFPVCDGRMGSGAVWLGADCSAWW